MFDEDVRQKLYNTRALAGRTGIILPDNGLALLLMGEVEGVNGEKDVR